MIEQFVNLMKAPRRDPQIETGCIYRHTGPGDIVETARVIRVHEDAMGIPHVSYDVMVSKSQAGFKERRTLNLKSFSEYFRDPVDA
jgi:hypothetical protein